MYYTLKDMAQIAGLNERTVLNYMQGTRRAHAAPTTKRRFWQFTEDDLTALCEAKLHAEQERTRTTHAAYMQPTDTSALEARVAELERQVAALLTRYNDNLAPPVDSPAYAPPKRVTATTASQKGNSKRPRIPAGMMHQNGWARLHGLAETTVKTHIKDEGVPLEHGEWIDGTTPVKHLLASEGQAMLHRIFHLGDPCQMCGWSSASTDNETPHTLEP